MSSEVGRDRRNVRDAASSVALAWLNAQEAAMDNIQTELEQSNKVGGLHTSNA